MTYSIVARDAATGQLGVAVHTAMFAGGAVVPWARAGVGAVASQAISEPAYGPRCLDRMALGESATAALEAARALDPLAPLRQVGVVDATGGAAAFTGELCIDCCGHLAGDGWAVQANMMASAYVWPAMAEAFQAAQGSLVRRLMAALHAAQGVGGDARGQMSAALIVVDGARHDDPWAGQLADLRVDRDVNPLDGLERLVDAAEAYAEFQRGVDALMAGDAATALAALDAGLAILPGEENLLFPRSGALLLAGREADSSAAVRELLAIRPSWSIVLKSFAEKGLIVLPPDLEL